MPPTDPTLPSHCAPIRRALTDMLLRLCGSAREMHDALCHSDSSLRGDLPDPQAMAPNTFADRAVDVLLRHLGFELDAMLDQLIARHPTHKADIEHLERLKWPCSCLRALAQAAPADRFAPQLGPALARHLRQHIPFAVDDLNALDRGDHDAFAITARHLIAQCRRPDLDPRQTAIELVRELIDGHADADTAGFDPQPLIAWLSRHSGQERPAAAGLKVLAARLVTDRRGGYTLAWLRAVRRGCQPVIFPRYNHRHIDDPAKLWAVLRPAVARLVQRRFISGPDQLLLRIEVESSHALDNFHKITDPRGGNAMTGTWFRAVTLWPWDYEPYDVIGHRYSGPLHRPHDPADGHCSATMAVCCAPAPAELLRKRRQQRPTVVCSESVWRPSDADGRPPCSPAVDAHDTLALSMLVDGDDVRAFVDHLFAKRNEIALADTFIAARHWLDAGRDIHLLWTDPDYSAEPMQLEYLPFADT